MISRPQLVVHPRNKPQMRALSLWKCLGRVVSGTSRVSFEENLSTSKVLLTDLLDHLLTKSDKISDRCYLLDTVWVGWCMWYTRGEAKWMWHTAVNECCIWLKPWLCLRTIAEVCFISQPCLNQSGEQRAERLGSGFRWFNLWSWCIK